MNIQDLINEIDIEQKIEKQQNEKAKIKVQEFKKRFYKTIWEQEQADLNLSLIVGK